MEKTEEVEVNNERTQGRRDKETEEMKLDNKKA